MYIIQNAWKSITRNKGRNILIGIVVFVIATASCVALSIREAAATAREDTLEGLSITAQISYDRSSAMKEMKENQGEIDREALKGQQMSLDDYMTYTKAQGKGDSYYYTTEASLNAAGGLKAYSSTDGSSEEVTEDTESEKTSGNGQVSGQQTGIESGGQEMGMPGWGEEGRAFMVQGDFSLTGYSSYDAMISLFGEDGTCAVTDGQMFDETSDEPECIISDELALYNNLSAGDVIKLANPNNEEETYEITISGIYTNSASDEGNNAFASSDPANNIYMNYNALNNIITSSSENAGTMTDDNGFERSTALTDQVNFTYTFADADNYYGFAEKVYDLGLGEDYTVSSSDLSAYENSLTPLDTLSGIAVWFFIIVLIVGGIILVVLNVFNLRERKYEVGVLTAIGMKKKKVACQFVCELFAVTFAAMVLGTSVGAGISVPVTNALLENQIESSQSSQETISENFGMGEDMPGQGGMPGGGPGSEGIKGDGTERQAGIFGQSASFVDSVTSATNIMVILQLLLVGIALTVISSLAALVTIMRYEPLKILSNRA